VFVQSNIRGVGGAFVVIGGGLRCRALLWLDAVNSLLDVVNSLLNAVNSLLDAVNSLLNVVLS